jgi:hypothetical protein
MPSRDPLLFATVTLDYSDIRMSLLSSNSYDFKGCNGNNVFRGIDARQVEVNGRDRVLEGVLSFSLFC